MLSSTSVINTEMVLNALMPVLGFIMVLLISFSLQSVFKLSKTTRYLLIIGLTVLAMLPLSGEWMLVMIKLNTRLLAVLNLSYIASGRPQIPLSVVLRWQHNNAGKVGLSACCRLPLSYLLFYYGGIWLLPSPSSAAPLPRYNWLTTVPFI